MRSPLVLTPTLILSLLVGSALSVGGCETAGLSLSTGGSAVPSAGKGRVASVSASVWCVGDPLGSSVEMSDEERGRLEAWQEYLTESTRTQSMRETCKAELPVCLDVASFRSEALAWPAGVGSDASPCEITMEAVEHACRSKEATRERLAASLPQVVCQRVSGQDPMDPSTLEIGREIGIARTSDGKRLVGRFWIKPRVDDYNEISSTKEEDFYSSSLWIQESF